MSRCHNNFLRKSRVAEKPMLNGRFVKVFKTWFGESNVVQKKPTMGGEDFSEFGRVEPRIPICMFDIGGVDTEAFKDSERTGRSLPSLHSPFWPSFLSPPSKPALPQ